jgi:hypothetical protein
MLFLMIAKSALVEITFLPCLIGVVASVDAYIAIGSGRGAQAVDCKQNDSVVCWLLEWALLEITCKVELNPPILSSP